MAEQRIEKIMELVGDHEKSWREQAAKQRPKAPYGQHRLTDEEHAVWFEMKMSQDPLWFAALPFVEGGKAELNRYNRTKRKGAGDVPA